MSLTDNERQRAERLLSGGMSMAGVKKLIDSSRAYSPKPKEVKSFGQKALEFGRDAFGGRIVGETVGESIAEEGIQVPFTDKFILGGHLAKGRKDYAKSVKQSLEQRPELRDDPEYVEGVRRAWKSLSPDLDHSTQEVLFDSAMVGLDLATLGKGKAVTAGIKTAAKETGEGVLKTTAKKIAGAGKSDIAQSTALGATFGGLEAGRQGGDIEDIKEGALIGGAAGLALPIAGQVAGKAFQKTKGLKDIFRGRRAVTGTAEGVIPKAVAGTAEEIAEKADEGFLTKLVSDESELLTRGEKVSALELKSEVGNEILNASKKADLHPDNPNALDTAFGFADKEVKAYKKHLSDTGENIGGIKDSLLTKTMKQGTSSLSELKSSLFSDLKKKGATLKDGKLSLSKTSPISKSDVVEIEDLLQGLDEVAGTGALKDVVNLIEKIDNSGIKFGETSKISQTLDRQLKKVRSSLKEIRDANLTKEEAKEFENYANMRYFLDNFRDKDSAIKLMLKRASSQLKGELKEASKEIQRVTGGNRVDRIGEVLASVLQASTSKSDQSLLKQMMGGEADFVMSALNPAGLISKATGGIAKKTFAKDRLRELEKFINITPNSGGTPSKLSKELPTAKKPPATQPKAVNQEPSPEIIPEKTPVVKKTDPFKNIDFPRSKNITDFAKEYKTFDEFVSDIQKVAGNPNSYVASNYGKEMTKLLNAINAADIKNMEQLKEIWNKANK